jgi:hypothetical protein
LDAIEFTDTLSMISYIQFMFVTFSLERKSNQKVQGQADRSARLSGQRHHLL